MTNRSTPEDLRNQACSPGPCSTTPSATCLIDSRRSIAVFWIQRKASGSLSPSFSCRTPLARSTALRVASDSWRSETSCLEHADLGVAADRHLDRRHQVPALEGLDEVGHRSRVTGPLDEVALREGGEDDDRRDPLAGDDLGGGDAVQDRHLHVEDDQVGAQVAGQLDRLLAVAGLADHVVALLAEHLGEVHPDECLVLGDHHAAYVGVSAGVCGLCHGGKASRVRFPRCRPR